MKSEGSETLTLNPNPNPNAMKFQNRNKHTINNFIHYLITY